MFISKLFPRHMQCDRPQVTAVVELHNDDIRKAVNLPPQSHADANDAQFEAQLKDADPELLRTMLRDLRRRLNGAEFAARMNAETIEAMRRRDRRG
jgi:hypothetical protein